MARSGNGTTDNIIGSGFTAPANFTIHIMHKNPDTPGSATNNKAGGFTDSADKGVDFNWHHTNGNFRQAWGYWDGGWKAAKYTTSLQADTWYALQCTYDGTNLRAYLNGVLEDTQAAGALDLVSDVVPVVMDSQDGSSTLAGEYADFAIWSVPLNTNELIALKRGKSPHLIRPESLVLYWPLWGTHSPEIDLSPTGNNGTLDGTTVATHPSVGLFTPKLVSNPIVDSIVSGSRSFRSDDKITTELATNSSQRSYAVWTYRTGEGGGALGRIWDKRTGADAESDLLFNTPTSTGFYRFTRDFSTQYGRWSIDRPAADEWHHVGVSYDSSSTSNDPVMYLDGISQSVTEDNTPSGTVVDTSSNFVIGNRGNDDARNWDGRLAWFAVWDVLLTANEFAALGQGKHPTTIRPESLVRCYPIWGKHSPEIDLSVNSQTATVTGTDIANGPPVTLFTSKWTTNNPLLEVPTGGARKFASAQSQYLEVDVAPLTAAPFTIMGWAKPTGLVNNEVLLWLGDKDVANNYFQIVAAGTDILRFVANAGAGNVLADTDNTFTGGQWSHFAARANSSSNRESILEGDFVNKGTNTSDRTPSGLDRISIGRSGSSAPSLYLNGTLALVGVWNVALTDDEITAGKNGVSPWKIRPGNLVALYPLWENESIEPDLISGGTALTVYGATKDNGPPVTTFTPKPSPPIPTVAFLSTTVSPTTKSSISLTGDLTLSSTLAPTTKSSIALIGTLTHAIWEGVLGISTKSAIVLTGDLSLNAVLAPVTKASIILSVTTSGVLTAITKASLALVDTGTYKSTLTPTTKSSISLTSDLTLNTTLAAVTKSSIVLTGTLVEAIWNGTLAISTKSSVSLVGDWTTNTRLAPVTKSSIVLTGTLVNAIWEGTLIISTKSSIVLSVTTNSQLVSITKASISLTGTLLLFLNTTISPTTKSSISIFGRWIGSTTVTPTTKSLISLTGTLTSFLNTTVSPATKSSISLVGDLTLNTTLAPTTKATLDLVDSYVASGILAAITKSAIILTGTLIEASWEGILDISTKSTSSFSGSLIASGLLNVVSKASISNVGDLTLTAMLDVSSKVSMEFAIFTKPTTYPNNLVIYTANGDTVIRYLNATTLTKTVKEL